MTDHDDAPAGADPADNLRRGAGPAARTGHDQAARLEGPAPTSELQGLAEEAAPSGGWSGQHPHLFHLSDWAPDRFDGGSLRGATGDNWPILRGQDGSVYMARLEPGGIREPHWHPNGWEFNFVISGRARWSIVGPRASHDQFEAAPGDLVFAPPGHFHYFENATEAEDLVVLIVFNTSLSEPDDDIGILASLSAIPPDVLGSVFGTSPDRFRDLPPRIERATITRKPK